MGTSTSELIDSTESLNHELQKKQMDFHVHIWNYDMVETFYYNSEFLGHPSAEDMLESFTPTKRTSALEI